MSRLASLSTPTRRQSPSPSPSPGPGSPGVVAVTETTHHRMLKLLIAELKSLFRTWDELVGMDGLKAGQAIVNAQTTMDNIVGIEEGPERESVGGHMVNLVEQRAALTSTMTKLERLVGKLALLIDQAEKIYLEAWAKQPADFFVEPLWYTWTIKHFLDSLPGLLHEHVLHLSLLSGLAQTISSPETSFDTAKLALERWLALSRGGQRWDAVREWEELVDLELAGYGQDMGDEDDEDEEEAVVKPRRKGKGGKR